MIDFSKLLLPPVEEGEEEGDGQYDLCDKYRGHYVDVTGGVDGWRGLYRNKPVTTNYYTRAAAREALIAYLKDTFGRR